VPDEEVPRSVYNRDIAAPVAACLKQRSLVDEVYYIVTTLEVPLKIAAGNPKVRDMSSLDSELAALYMDIKTGKPHPAAGTIPNPFFGQRERVFSHPSFPLYLVTRLAAYDTNGVKAMIDRGLQARNRGTFVIDLNENNDQQGNDWLRDAAVFLPPNRVVFNEDKTPVYDRKNVIGYASWGSNDENRKRRFAGFEWLPGAIATEYVSTDARTFARPPQNWTPSSDWSSLLHSFGGTAQSLSADLIQEGATGASGHVYEPFLGFTPRPNLLLPAYFSGRNLAESYWLSIPVLSWQNVVIGDPLCALGKP
jgi:uncharacterized protein (TIGR03790 family)